MKTIFTLSLGIMGMIGSLSAQSQMNITPDKNPLKSIETHSMTSAEQSSSRGSQVCSDTNLWAWARSFNGGAASYFGTFMHKEGFQINSYGTYVDVPSGTTMDVSGFEFYGRSLRPDGAAVTATALIYKAGPDSLPTGAPLQSITVSLDTNTTNVINDFFVSAQFSAPASVTGSFILTIENSNTVGDSIEVVRGFTGSGAADEFPVVYQVDSINSGNYFRNYGGALGARLPHFYPYVQFNQTNNFSMSVSQLSGPNEDVDFDHVAFDVMDHPIWSFSGFLNFATTYWSIDGGNSFSVALASDTTINFADETQDYPIVLHDSLAMWNGSTCLMTESKTLLAASVTSVEDVQNAQFKAFTQNGEIIIKNATEEVQLFNITGRMVKSMPVKSSLFGMNVSELPSGVYILRTGNQAIKLNL